MIDSFFDMLTKNSCNRKNILFNATTLRVGGAIQVALSIIDQIILDQDHGFLWHILVSKEVYEQLSESAKQYPFLILITKSPAKSLSTRKMIKNLVSCLEINLVFTLFGPAYVNFSVTHFCGVADGWVTHGDLLVYSSLESCREKFEMYLLCFYKKFWFKKADYWFVEADVARSGLVERLGLNNDNIFTVRNTVSHFYEDILIKKDKFFLENGLLNLVVVGADYPHKNLQIIPKVCLALLRMGFSSFIFTLTISKGSKQWKRISNELMKHDLLDYVKTVGNFNVSQGPLIYQKADFLFFPTLIETYSVTPLESVYMETPVIASNIASNREVLGDAGVYFHPKSSENAASSILYATKNYITLLEKTRVLKKFYKDQKYAELNRYLCYKKKIVELMSH